MRGLLHAELLKVFGTRVWWGLLIPVAAIAVLLGFAGAAITGLPSVTEETGVAVPAAALMLPISMKQSAIFAAVLGVIGGAGEFRHRTIATTYLTAPSRGAVLAAKAAVYGVMGLGYGLVTALAGVLGGLAGSGADAFPPPGDTLLVIGAGCLGVALWGVLGVGLGMLLANQVVVLIVLLVYLVFGETLIALALTLPAIGTEDLPRYLPESGTTALMTDHGITVFAEVFGEEYAFATREIVEGLVGDAGQLSWWGGGLLLAGYTAAAVGGAWLRGARRDIA
ncbi:MAG TPA: hypothetical protein VGD67_03700 [Pseudonocardiaceae bacterium]